METSETPDKKDNLHILRPRPGLPEPLVEEEEEVPPPQQGLPSKLTKDSLNEYQQALLVRNAKKILPTTFKALAKLIGQNDRKAIEIALQAYGYVGKGGGVTVINNLQQVNNESTAARESIDRPYFESVIRELEKKQNVIDAVSMEMED